MPPRVSNWHSWAQLKLSPLNILLLINGPLLSLGIYCTILQSWARVFKITLRLATVRLFQMVSRLALSHIFQQKKIGSLAFCVIASVILHHIVFASVKLHRVRNFHGCNFRTCPSLRFLPAL